MRVGRSVSAAEARKGNPSKATVPSRTPRQTAAIAKLKTGILAREVANLSLQIHGGYGYMDEFPISRFYRDAKILEIGEGTNEVQQMVIARGLGVKLH